MLIELGQRMIGRCCLRFSGCTAKGFNIVKKVFIARDGETEWLCHHCYIEKVNIDQLAYEQKRKEGIASLQALSS